MYLFYCAYKNNCAQEKPEWDNYGSIFKESLMALTKLEENSKKVLIYDIKGKVMSLVNHDAFTRFTFPDFWIK